MEVNDQKWLKTPAMGFVLIAFMGCLFCACQEKKIAAQVSLEKLLDEMVSVEEQARLPDPYYAGKQVSSYDRSSVSPDSTHWFANADGFGIERIDTVDGRLEKVLFDEQGPGAITRIWITTIDKRGTWRFYFDGQKEPGWTMPAYDLMKFGLSSLGKGLLQAHTSYTPDGKGGNTLFLPIPYSKSCKVTFEDLKGLEPTPKYYQINYRKYAEGTKVETFSKEVAERAADKIKVVDSLLLNPSPARGRVSEKKQLLAAGDSLMLDLPKGENAVYRVAFDVAMEDTADKAQMMRDLVFKASFDGKQTVWVPLSDYAGGGMGSPFVKSWYLDADGKGKVTSRWLMPYKEKGELVLQNASKKAVSVLVSAHVASLPWDNRSLYFYASWKQERNIPVHDKPEEDKKVHEWNFTTLRGTGIYKGDMLTLYNHSPAWYGEGDEKIWVDRDTFPSHFGTGTEDYYNSSWAPVIPFQTPFGGAPRADQESSHGYNTFFRTRHLDGIPFKEGLRFDIEMLSWVKGRVDYATTVYWYGSYQAEAENTSGLEEATVKLQPIPEDLGKYKIPHSIEFEDLKPGSKSAAIQLEKQNMYGFPSGKWSGAAQATAGGGKPGDSIVYQLRDLQRANYRLTIYGTKSADYGIVTFFVNDKPTNIYFDGYNDGVAQTQLPLGSFFPINGTIKLEIRITGANKEMLGKRYMFGLDCIQLMKN
ncbi:MAG TPA: glycoside hydrolase family 172 protein [Pseudosphingobacterium sp.]|nr:glycoside hydrolase family 172 protein [Pseudosphingobacterium sp.]